MMGGSYRGGLAQNRRFGGEAGRNRNLIHTIITLCLLVALIVTLIITVPSLHVRDDCRTEYVTTIQNECSAAVSTLQKLSSSGTYIVYEQLAVIRSNIHAIEVLNKDYADMNNGEYLVDQTLVTDLISTISVYYNQLSLGNNTTEQLSSLTTQLDTLRTSVEKLH